MPIATSYGTGRYQASETDLQLVPKLGQGINRSGILFCHGAGDLGSALSVTSKTGTFPLFRRLAEYFPIIGPDLGGATTWGNATAVTRTGTARTYLINTMRAKSPAVHLVGISMGALTALQYAAANPTLVKSIVLIIGAIDLDYTYQNDVSGARSQIEAAWSVSFPAALPAGAILLGNTTAWDSIPVLAYYVNNDIFTPAASSESLFGSMNKCTLVNLGALSHSEAAIAAAPINDIVSFLTSNEAPNGGDDAIAKLQLHYSASTGGKELLARYFADNGVNPRNKDALRAFYLSTTGASTSLSTKDLASLHWAAYLP